MRFLDFVSVRLAFWLILGILFGYYGAPKIQWVLGTGILSLGILGFSRYYPNWKNIPVFGLGLALCVGAIGTFGLGMTMPGNVPSHYTKIITTTDHNLHLKIREVLKPNDYSHRYVVRVVGIDGNSTSGKCILSIPKATETPGLHVDDEILVYSTPTPLNPPLNPYQFDYKSYMKKQGIFHQIRVDNGAYVPLKNVSKTLIGRAANFREVLISILRTYDFGAAQLGVMQALLLGQRADISEATYNNYKNAGAVHILAVSGLHVGILLLLLQFLLQPLERLPQGRIVKLVSTVLLLWIYAVIAGLSPSIVRAVTMFSFIAYAFYLNRPTNTFNIVVLSMVFILLIKPLFLFQVGFQLSYAAVFAIVWIFPKLQRFWNPENFLVKKGWQLFSVSIAAQLGVLPLSLLYFHQFPALFFVSNLIVVPFLGGILGLGLVVVILGYCNVLPKILVWGYNEMIGTMNATIAWVARQEAFIFKDIPFDGIQLFVGYLLIFGLVFTLSKASFRHLVFFLSTILVFSVYLVFQEVSTRNTERLILAHQTKNSILLYQAGNQLNVLASDTTTTERIVTNYKVAKRIKTIHHDGLRNNYLLGEKQLMIVDSAALLPKGIAPDYLLFTQSPRLNVGRLLDSIQPKMVLADGSNYRSYIPRWKRSCKKRNIPFHYTGDAAAYYFEEL